MSETWYVYLAVGGTFVAVLSAGLTYVAARRGRRPAEVLHTQLQTAGFAVSVRPDHALTGRAVEQTVTRLASMATRLAPRGTRDKTAHRLVLAGSPKGWTAERVLAMKAMLAGLGLVLGFTTGGLLGSGIIRLVPSIVGGVIGFVLPGAMVSQAAVRRQDRIRRLLPDTMDLLTISVEAGLSFDAALLHVRRRVKGPLSEEIGRMLHEIQLGVRRPDAMRHLAERTTVDELKGFVIAMVQADTFGVSIASVLRAQAKELRTKRRQHAEERAMKIPVKLLFPMIFCIMPALFVVIIGPGAIKIYDGLVKGSGLI
jgi:tight adherence protein C